MLFNSLQFPVFLGAALAVFWLSPARARPALLLAISFAFYAWFSVVHAVLLAAVTVWVWWCAERIRATEDESRMWRWCALGVGAQLTLLASFKYLPSAAGGLGFALAIAAPVGISYYSFKLIGYLIDAYWGKLKTPHGLLDLARYAAFFPQILAGPIQRAEDFFAQQRRQEQSPGLDQALFTSGLRLMLFGFFKKLVVADRAAIVVDQVYASPDAFPAVTVWLACYLYAIQLYADFSGLTDIAIGTGRLFGVRSPKNFDSPYYAPTIQDFWRRWHLSLTTWLTDYLFTPLRMALRNAGNAGLVIAITVNMLAIGIWHGPRWTFAVFGLLNAVYMIGSALTARRQTQFFARHPRLATARRWLGPLLVFHLITIAFIAFRSPDLATMLAVAPKFFAGMAQAPAHFLGRAGFGPLTMWSATHTLALLASIGAMELVHLLQTAGRLPSLVWARARPLRWAAYYGLTAAILLFARPGQQAPIYFKF